MQNPTATGHGPPVTAQALCERRILGGTRPVAPTIAEVLQLAHKFTLENDSPLRTLLGAFRACPAPRRERTAMERRPYRWIRGCALCLGRCGRRWNAVPTAGSDRSVASPNGRAGARPSRGFGPVAGANLRSPRRSFAPRGRVPSRRRRAAPRHPRSPSPRGAIPARRDRALPRRPRPSGSASARRSSRRCVP